MTRFEISRAHTAGLVSRGRELGRLIRAHLDHASSSGSRTWDKDPEFLARQEEAGLITRELEERPKGSGAGREDTDGTREGYRSHAPVHDSRGRQYSPGQVEQLRAFGNLMRGGESAVERSHPGILQRASLSTGSGPVGGYLVPEFVQAEVIQDLAKFQTVRRLGASTRTLIGKENLPVIADPEAAFITEATAVSTGMSQTDPTFGQVEIRPQLVYATTNYSWHVQQFSPADVENEIRKSFGRAIAKTTAQKYLTGTGTNQPMGIVTGSGVGVTAAATTEFTAEEITQLWYSLDPWHQLDAAWIMRPEAATLLRTLESDNGHPLWVRDMSSGADTLFGRPVVTDPYMPAMTAGLRPVIVGSMAEAYVIAESMIFAVVDPFSRARHAENVITFYQFVDGRVRRSDACKALVMNSGL